MPRGAAKLLSKLAPDPEQRWIALLDEADRLIDYDTSAARAVLLEAMTYVEDTWGEDDVHLIRPLRFIAESFWREHEPLDPNNAKEVECLQRALAIARRRLSPDHLEVARLAGELGSHLVIGGLVDAGCELMIECVEVATKNGSEEDFARYLSLIALARMEQARPVDALPFLERLTLVRERRDASSIGHALARYHLGKCLFAVGRRQDAIAQLELALSIVDAHRAHGKHATLMNEIMDLIERVKSGLSADTTPEP